MAFSKRRLTFIVGFAVVAFIAFASAATYVSVSTSTPSSLGFTGPRIPIRGASGQSLNWAGYAVTSSAGSVTSVSGSWKVPTVSCAKKSSYAAFWVGIDGFNDNTVEQTGVLAQCSSGSATYSAWYEFYPASPVYASSSDAVKPGDIMSASVTYSSSGNCFTTTLTDVTEGWTYTSPCTAVTGAQRSSAEWITERPAIGNSLTTLADFGTAYYGYDYTSVSSTNYVTINGVTTPMGSSTGTLNSITMVSSGPGSKTLASPSPVSSDYTSFSVTYASSSGGTSHGPH
ncbi:MAG: G1 family glutamic endopeptidase [Thermoprotei archaeon]